MNSNIKQPTPHQLAAGKKLIEALVTNKEVSLTGAAGTGKTTLLPWLVDQLAAAGHTAVVCAPTNRAAAVLCKKGIEATTIHKKFFVPLDVNADEPEYIACDQWLDENPGKSLPEGKASYVDLAVIDEASMVHSDIVADLQRMAGKIVFVGDGNQLPPVKDYEHPRGYFNTLKHTAMLTEVLRHSGPILDMATHVRNGTVALQSPKVVAGFSKDLTFNGMTLAQLIVCYDVLLMNWRIITHSNATRRKMNQMVRAIYGHTTYSPQAGERVMLFKNFNDVLLNGTEMVVVEEPTMPTDARITELVALYRKDPLQFSPSKIMGGPACLEFAFPRICLQDEKGVVHEVIMNLLNFMELSYDVTHPRRVRKGTVPKDVATVLYLIEQTAKAWMGDDKEPAVTFDYCYATTCHKAQGSEYGHTIVIDQRQQIYWVAEQEMKKAKSTKPLDGEENLRRWLYTAMTRAQNTLTFVGESEIGGQ